MDLPKVECPSRRRSLVPSKSPLRVTIALVRELFYFSTDAGRESFTPAVDSAENGQSSQRSDLCQVKSAGVGQSREEDGKHHLARNNQRNII